MKKNIINPINASWREGKLPEAWKRAKIKPIPKPKDRANPRLIRILSCINKTAEKMVRGRLEHVIGLLHP